MKALPPLIVWNVRACATGEDRARGSQGYMAIVYCVRKNGDDGTTDGIAVPQGWPMDEHIINTSSIWTLTRESDGRKLAVQGGGADIIKKTVPDIVIGMIDVFGNLLDSLLPPPYADELRGLAEATQIPVGELFVLNLGYDITAYCTSIVAQSSGGSLLHARNLDGPPEMLPILSIMRKTTFTAHFQRGGKTVYAGVINAGVIGIANPQYQSMSVVQAASGQTFSNFFLIPRDLPFPSWSEMLLLTLT